MSECMSVCRRAVHTPVQRGASREVVAQRHRVVSLHQLLELSEQMMATNGNGGLRISKNTK